MSIIWLGRRDCPGCAFVGGKGMNLCHLAADYNVPPTFSIPASACTEWIASGADECASLSPALLAELDAAYATLAERCGIEAPSVAVRSSAVDEDGAVVSFAGQHETHLNISGVADIAQAIVRCWASAHSSHALVYRRKQGLALDCALAVLVQQFIPADVSMVVFSANSVTGSRDEVVINANWGLGESIVGGAVTPDSYVVRKADLVVTAQQIADKQRMNVPAPHGTREIPVPRLLRTHPALSDIQIGEVARLALSLEASTLGPVDVECAYRGQSLYLLQCRPITSLGR
jgi:phosphoenolpyruvate synthase/pyruvate phosphate dikinase